MGELPVGVWLVTLTSLSAYHCSQPSFAAFSQSLILRDAFEPEYAYYLFLTLGWTIHFVTLKRSKVGGSLWIFNRILRAHGYPFHPILFIRPYYLYQSTEHQKPVLKGYVYTKSLAEFGKSS